ncbi:MAG: hypothetical protein J6Y57_03900, partial [Lachnospiraceae bacterium]|nr:hypothetical protein [Lachnospiraceae bacterium]
EDGALAVNAVKVKVSANGKLASTSTQDLHNEYMISVKKSPVKINVKIGADKVGTNYEIICE